MKRVNTINASRFIIAGNDDGVTAPGHVLVAIAGPSDEAYYDDTPEAITYLDTDRWDVFTPDQAREVAKALTVAADAAEEETRA